MRKISIIIFLFLCHCNLNALSTLNDKTEKNIPILELKCSDQLYSPIFYKGVSLNQSYIPLFKEKLVKELFVYYLEADSSINKLIYNAKFDKEGWIVKSKAGKDLKNNKISQILNLNYFIVDSSIIVNSKHTIVRSKTEPTYFMFFNDFYDENGIYKNIIPKRYSIKDSIIYFSISTFKNGSIKNINKFLENGEPVFFAKFVEDCIEKKSLFETPNFLTYFSDLDVDSIHSIKNKYNQIIFSKYYHLGDFKTFEDLSNRKFYYLYNRKGLFKKIIVIDEIIENNNIKVVKSNYIFKYNYW